MNDPSVLLYMHIPKAAGTSFSELIYSNCCDERHYVDAEGYLHAGVYYFPVGFFRDWAEPLPEIVPATLARSDLRAVAGHCWYGIHEYVLRPTRYVTLLRNPLDRTISLYCHLNLVDVMSLEDFIRHPPYREADNGQTRRISGNDPEVGQCTAAMLQRAKENLRDRFAVVGVMERYEETALQLKRVMGWTKEINCYPRNRTTSRMAASSVSNQVADLVQRHEAYDVELYGYAQELLRAATAAQDAGFWSEVEQLKAQSSVWLSAPPAQLPIEKSSSSA